MGRSCVRVVTRDVRFMLGAAPESTGGRWLANALRAFAAWVRGRAAGGREVMAGRPECLGARPEGICRDKQDLGT